MIKSRNEPYVKEYKDGKVINPITQVYPARGMNRKERRKHMQKSNRKAFNAFIRSKHS